MDGFTFQPLAPTTRTGDFPTYNEAKILLHAEPGIFCFMEKAIPLQEWLSNKSLN
jgi:hypothetical protein